MMSVVRKPLLEKREKGRTRLRIWIASANWASSGSLIDCYPWLTPQPRGANLGHRA